MWSRVGDTLEALRESIESEMLSRVGKVVTEDEFPCMYSEAANPHPPIVEGEWQCDGYGNMLSASTGCISGERCRCFRSHQERRFEAGYLSRLPLPVKSQVESADPKAHALAKVFEAWNFRTPGVLLVGNPGTGKTVAGHRIILEWIKRNHCEGAFYSCQGIADEFRRMAFSSPPEKDEIGRIVLQRDDIAQSNRHAVFLDDLGQGRESEAVIQDIRGFIRKRYDIAGPTVLTTNLTGAAIRETYGADILDRLSDPRWMQVVKISGGSVRKTTSESHQQTVHWQDR